MDEKSINTEKMIGNLKIDLIEKIKEQIESGNLDNRLRVPEENESGEEISVLKSFTDPKLYLENMIKIDRRVFPDMPEKFILNMIDQSLNLKSESDEFLK